MKMKVLLDRSMTVFVLFCLLNLLVIVYLHYEETVFTSFSTRRLTLRENIETGLQFFHLNSLAAPGAEAPIVTEKDHVTFLEPEKVHAQKPSLLSQAISFLDLSVVKAKERLHLENLQKKREQQSTDTTSSSEITTAKVDSPSQQNKKADTSLEFLDTTTLPVKPKPKKKPKAKPSTPNPDTDTFQNIHFGGSKKSHKPAEKSLSHVSINTNLDGAESEVIEAHPHYSPRKGTDISPTNYDKLLLCPNQSKCIIPELQLKRKYKIYFCRHPVSYGVRFYFLAREGLLLHPNIELLSYNRIHEADYIIYLPGSAPWHKTECNQTSYGSRLIVLDEFDGHTLFLPTRTKEEYVTKYGSLANPWYYLYFKRSFVRRIDGKFIGYPHIKQFETYPMVYAVAEAYIAHRFNREREIDILCTLRGSIHMTTRLRVQNWVAEYGKERNVPNVISSQVDGKQRTTISLRYFDQMRHAKIIVTVNPANWEGDFRLWESMCTGALIFVDPLFVPHPFPLIDKYHVVYFSNQNRSDLFAKLDYYRSHPEEAQRIALNGYFHAMKQHRTINLMDYILRTAHTRNATIHKEELPNYQYTGQYLNYMTRLQEKMIIKCQYPGIFEPLQAINGSNYARHLTSCPQNNL